MQWGYQSSTGTSTTGAWISVSFPRNFGRVYGVFANRIINAEGADGNYVGYLNHNATISGFEYRKRPKDSMYWLAIGTS